MRFVSPGPGHRRDAELEDAWPRPEPWSQGPAARPPPYLGRGLHCLQSGLAGPTTFPPHLVTVLILAGRPRPPEQPVMGTRTPPLHSEVGALIS